MIRIFGVYMHRIQSFLLKFKLSLIIGAVTIVGVFCAFKYVSNLKNNLAASQIEVTTLATKLRLQNGAVAQLKKDMEQRKALHDEELKEARKQSVIIQEKAKVIYKTQPSVPNDLCKSALDLINGVKP